MADFRTIIAEIIGRSADAFAARFGSASRQRSDSVDLTRLDYGFFDRLYRGQEPGYQISGLLSRPVIKAITTFTIGEPPAIRSANKYMQTVTNTWLQAMAGRIIQGVEDSLRLGDGYWYVDPNGRLITISPDRVEVNVDPLAVWKTNSITVESVVTQDNQKQVVQEEWFADSRVQRTKSLGATTWDASRRLPNPYGIIPIVHLPNDHGSNEVYGHAETEAIVVAQKRYEEILNYAISGNRMMGRPTPVIEGLENLQKFLETFGEKDPQTGKVQINFNPDRMMIVGKGGKFNFAQPGAFVGESKILLELLYWLIAQHTRVPEFVWGLAIASSKASAETQMPPFLQLVTEKRTQLEGIAGDADMKRPSEGGLHQLIEVYWRVRSAFDRKVDARADKEIDFPLLDKQDGELTLKQVALALERGLITKETALSLLELVDDPAAESKKAELERQQRIEKAERRAAQQPPGDRQANLQPDRQPDQQPAQAQGGQPPQGGQE